MIVLDASAMGAMLLQDHDISFVTEIEAALARSTISGPAHWPVEVMNLLVKSSRHGRTPVTDLPGLWARAEMFFDAAHIEPLKVDSALLELSNNTALTPRDASYVELAARRGFVLCTADRAMIRACRTLSISLLAPTL